VVARSGGGVRLCGHERKTGEGEVRKGSETESFCPRPLYWAEWTLPPFFSFFSLLFSVLCLLFVVVLLVAFFFWSVF
jgi:hypothetical protein